MMFLLVGFALLLHVAFWGAGLARLTMPRRWRAFWPVIVFPCGFALQSAIVWAGAHTSLRGTNAYALASEVVPALLLAFALRRGGARAAWSELRRLRWVFTAVAIVLLLLILPLAIAAKGLTTVSLGSCDAADYAAGARTLMEFARGDRGGFIGLTDVVRTQSVDNFFDFWLRLNHFTPSALIAFNGSVLRCAPHELTSLFAMVVLAAAIPLAFWMARATVGLRAGASLFVAVCYGVSPVTWWTVAQVSPAQMLAAQAIVLLTWTGFALWRGPLARRDGLSFLPLLVIAYWLILGSYNFILLVALAPALAFAGGLALRRGRWLRFAAWLAAMLVPLGMSAVLFWMRVAGLAERFALFRTFDFGWKIPALSPEGWFAFVDRAPGLIGFGPVLRVALSLVLVGLLAIALRRRGALAWRVAALLGPALAGYAYLEWRGATLGTNASYDAFKLLAVFFPGILAAAAAWLVWLNGRGWQRQLAFLAAGFVGLAHAISLSQFIHALESPPLRVSFALRDLRNIEAMPDVRSINMLIPDMWSRLWANEFLLRKAQYFRTDTYEARWHTPLRGDWDLELGPLARSPEPGGRRLVTPHTALVDTHAPAYFRATATDGWHALEIWPPTGERWRWTAPDATVRLENPHAYPLKLTCTLDARAVDSRAVTLALVHGPSTPPVQVTEERGRRTFASLVLPPGESTLVLHSGPAGHAPGDPRPLALCLFELELAARVE